MAPDTFVASIAQREIIEEILATLVSLAVPEARRLEAALIEVDEDKPIAAKATLKHS